MPGKQRQRRRMEHLTWQQRCSRADAEDKTFPDGHVHPVPPVPQKVPLLSGELKGALSASAYAACPWPGACTSVGPKATIVGWPRPGEVELEIEMPMYSNHTAIYRVRALLQRCCVKARRTVRPEDSSSGSSPAAADRRAPKRRRAGSSG